MFGKVELGELERFKGEAARREVERIRSKTGNVDFSFENLLSKIDTMLGKICSCYDKDMPYRLMEIFDYHLVLSWLIARDACFILEFFRCFQETSDPFLGLQSENPVVISEIMKDLIKLENQIPLFVLEEVLAMEQVDAHEEVVAMEQVDAPEAVAAPDEVIAMEESSRHKKAPKSALQELLKVVFRGEYYGPFDYFPDKESPWQNHLLDIYYYYCLGEGNEYGPLDRKESKEVAESFKKCKFPSAVELMNGGVQIKAKGGKVQDVGFRCRTLFIPPIKFDVDSEILIRNLIALEVCSTYLVSKSLTEYVQLMDELCQTEKGVSLMREKRIIIGDLRNPSRVIQLLNFTSLAQFQPTCFSFLLTKAELIKYYRRKYRVSSAVVWNEFWDAYVSKPWLVIGGIGATILLLLTGVQVFCLFKNCGAR
ncbi:hypothetical protein SUGI_0570550 [Cryptomeria japonica]|uniref:uncharacterized protein LOC131876282 n=1 Tax=Cryptomeria japonica TaxID=3369 RepID=UPI002408A57C|nr:uncharacterized protein LOC131876282 [Cryptomeria japonica]GLJ28928.1 hypothetical protein SUGI_0570550 [Cryptomeria japonica]